MASSQTDAGEIYGDGVRLRTAPGTSSSYYKRLLQSGETFSLVASKKKVYKDNYTWVCIDVGWAEGWVAEKYVTYYA